MEYHSNKNSQEVVQWHNILEIAWGITWRYIRIEVGQEKWSAKDKYFNLSEKWTQGENMVGTTIAKDQFTDTRWTYTKETIDFKRSFHDKIYIVSMGMNTKFKAGSHFSNA